MTVLSSYRIGEFLPEVELEPVTRIDLIKYAGASGDYNPIHTIDEEARKLGLRGIIAHGMWTMGNLSKLFSDYYEEGYMREYSVRFKGMVFLHDVITLRAEVVETGIDHARFNVSAINQDEKKVIDGKLTFQFYRH
ncbi:dehydratase (plasmid) [Cytobacillus spongiae]|uniref:MaoC/PaaZ C-terminal domain-containing protein n=1 Tax=Cytobacillus spongiae TaxID=2901381 RepID=UPI001CD60394|nr:MaoC/PaaZ C-terminal domain-containing protein [Cytobacillus spongiae]MCA1062806.1 dehydratase [Rossellomorea aquimaris]UII58418.1 dehydratase [Cytobacillus spongiae]WJV28546.1 MaoC/PaaZ C-terminal domain-containing protein [Rossellomorea sp. AcN35-11]